MFQIRKNFLLAAGLLMLMCVGTNSLASAPALSTDIFQMDMMSYEFMNKQAAMKAAGCQALEDQEYNDCMKVMLENILTRRDQNDGTVAKLFAVHYYKLDDDLRNSLMMKITDDAIDRIKDESAKMNDRASSIEILKNIIAELNPKSNEHRPIIQKICDANLKIDDDIMNLRLKKMGLKTVSPSEIAKALLARVPQQEDFKAPGASNVVPAKHKIIKDKNDMSGANL